MKLAEKTKAAATITLLGHEFKRRGMIQASKEAKEISDKLWKDVGVSTTLHFVVNTNDRQP